MAVSSGQVLTSALPWSYCNAGMTRSPASGVVYVAATTNRAFLGGAPLDEIAAHINRCAGRSGTNVDYLLELARELRHLDISDPHVFELEALVLATQD